MFLSRSWISFSLRGTTFPERGRVVVRLLLGVLAASAYACAQSACVVEIPVYDTSGNKLEFNVTAVAPQDRRDVNLLSLRPNAVRSVGDRISFSDRTLLRRVLVVTLENARGAKITQPVFLMQCPQRTSIRFGSSEAPGDVEFDTMRGRLSGCRFVGDWWVRAMPMFGASTSPAALEGYIQPDGSFSLSGQMAGERHLVVFGKDKQPVLAIGVNVTVGRANEVGTLDLTGHCPK